jgi:hypothetical protein
MLRRKHVTEQGGLLRRDTITQAERRKQNLGKRSKMDGALPAIEAVDGCRSMARRDVARRSRQTSTCASTPTPRLETSRKIHLRSRLKNSILTAATPSSATVSDFSNRGGLFLVGRGARYAAPVNFGAPDTIRTCGLRLRRATLYPAELRVHLLLTQCLRGFFASVKRRAAFSQVFEFKTSFKLLFCSNWVDTCLRRDWTLITRLICISAQHAALMISSHSA